MVKMPKIRAEKPGRARVLIVDAQPVVRERVADVISREPDLVLCGDADNPLNAFEIAETCGPDLIVTGLRLKDAHGLEFIKDLRARSNARVLVFSVYDELLYAERAIRAGALGFVSKHETTQELLRAIRRVLEGEIYLSDRLTAHAMRCFFEGRARTAGRDWLSQLSDREIEVFELIGRGRTTRQIATALHLDIKTVQTYRARIKAKLKLETPRELEQQAQQVVEKNVLKPPS
jgi:DNA-binding NarL/FixJ family response regulator